MYCAYCCSFVQLSYSLERLYLETAVRICVAVEATTHLNVSIIPVTPLKSVER